MVKLMLVVPWGLFAEAGGLELKVPANAAKKMHTVIRERSFNRNQ
jgi:hypothetical protein